VIKIVSSTDKFMIHTYSKRLWYVEEFLIPSMEAQGINGDNIRIMLDDGTFGCLDSFFTSLKESKGEADEATWHLQDDVIICRDFKVRTVDTDYPLGIVNGYCWTKDFQRYSIGKVPAFQMWYSFPCIRIPNQIGTSAAEWFYTKAINDPRYKKMIEEKKNDDYLFREFIMEKDYSAINLSPNLVDHIDYLIGGSIVNEKRADKEGVQSMALYFEDKDLIDELEKKLRMRKVNQNG